MSTLALLYTSGLKCHFYFFEKSIFLVILLSSTLCREVYFSGCTGPAGVIPLLLLLLLFKWSKRRLAVTPRGRAFAQRPSSRNQPRGWRIGTTTA